MFDWGRGDDEPDPEAARERMVDGVRGRIDHPSTAEALGAVPRHTFVPENRREAAYRDRPLPIGSGQTISAPHMVAEMVDRLDLDPGDRILEIGTGCGYHAAVTAEVVGADNVYSVEYHAALAEQARETLAELGYADVSIRVGDGHEGWPAHAPYDAVYLTCAPAEFPEAVIEQVRDGGQLLGPLGRGTQRLVHAHKEADGLARQSCGGVRFVPMHGGD